MTPWVRRLIIANIVMYGLQYFVPGLTRMLELVPVELLVHPWTIITYMFLHDPSSIWHIVFNMLVLYWFGPRVEERLGGRNFIALYLSSGLGGGILSCLMAANAAVLGASGAIMGVLIAFAMYWPRERVYIWGVLPVEMWMMVAGYVVLDLVGFGANVAHFAHLGGLATGFLYLKIMEVRSPARAWRKKVTGPQKSPVVGGIGNGDPLKRWRDIRLDDLHPINRDEIVRLLQKAQQLGTRSLTPEERATLDRFAGSV